MAGKTTGKKTKSILDALEGKRGRTTSMRDRNQVTIPQVVAEAAQLEVGDTFEVRVTSEGILLRPQKLIDATQAWFWTPEWQAGEREADQDVSAGRTEFFESGPEFLAALEMRSKPLRRTRQERSKR